MIIQKGESSLRKIAALFLVLAIVVAFAGCRRKDKEETTAPIITASTKPSASTTQATPSSSEPTSQLNANPTYILTTSPDKTVPWGDTTKFTTMPSTTMPSSIVINIPTDGSTQPVTPSYSVAPSQPTTPVISVSGSDASSKPGKTSTSATKPTKPTTTKPVEKKPVSVSVGAKAFNGEDVLIVDIEGSNWSSVFVANTQYLPVSIDGNPTGKNVKCALSGSPDAAGNYTISVDVSSLSLAPGAVVSVDFPEGYIQTKAGTQYSNSFEVFATF